MSEIKVDTLTGKTTANDITVTVGASATQSLEQGLCKAFIYQNAGTTILKSFNVSTLVDNGTGDYIVNFSNNMDDVNYIPTSAIQPHNYTSNSVMVIHGTRDNTDQNTDHFHQKAGRVSSSSAVDSAGMRSTVHGDLA